MSKTRAVLANMFKSKLYSVHIVNDAGRERLILRE